MKGKDVERIINVICRINNEVSKQIELLTYESDYRIALIDHTHTVHVSDKNKGYAENGSPEGTPNGEHSHGDGSHVNKIDILLTGRQDPPATNYESPDPGHSGPHHFDTVSDQKTYPVAEERGYLDDKHTPYTKMDGRNEYTIDNPKYYSGGDYTKYDKFPEGFEPPSDHHKHIEPERLYEREHPDPAEKYITPIWTLSEEFNEDVWKIKMIEVNHFIENENQNDKVDQWFNNYASPYREIYDLREKTRIIKNYGETYPQLQWMGEKQGLLHLLQMLYTCTIDTKMALIFYQDYIQRAYDNLFNGNRPSITWDDFVYYKTYGNIMTQIFEENVRLPAPTNIPDPYSPNP